MLGFGETDEEVLQTMQGRRRHRYESSRLQSALKVLL